MSSAEIDVKNFRSQLLHDRLFSTRLMIFFILNFLEQGILQKNPIYLRFDHVSASVTFDRIPRKQSN